MKTVILKLSFLFLVLAIPTVHASAPLNGTGTITTLSETPLSFRTAGGNIFVTLTDSDSFTGVLTGTTNGHLKVTVFSDGSLQFSDLDSFTGSVNGASGTLTLHVVGTADANGNFVGQFVVLNGTGGLTTLHGQGIFSGTEESSTYTFNYHWDP